MFETNHCTHIGKRRFFPRGPVASGLLVLALAGLAGCSGGTPRAGTSAGADVPAQTQSKSSDAGISERTLEERGFVTHWSAHPVASVEQCWHISDNLYVTRQAERGQCFLEKIDGETGQLAWSFSIEGRLEYPPTVYRYPRELRATRPDELYIVQHLASGGDHIFCLDDKFGAENYRFECTLPSTSAVASQDHVFFGSWNYRVYGFSKASKLELWTYRTDGAVTAAPEVGEFEVYIGSEDGVMHSFNQAAGFVPTKSWRTSTGGKIVAPPLFYRGSVYCGSWDYKVYCLANYQGTPKWTFPSGAPITQRLFPFRDFIFAINEKEEGWVEHKGDPNSTRRTFTLFALDHAIGPDKGAPKWDRAGMRQVLSADNFFCYVLDQAGTIHALRLEDGKTAWSLEPSGFDMVLTQDAERSAAPERWGRIYLVARNGMMQCIRPRR